MTSSPAERLQEARCLIQDGQKAAALAVVKGVLVEDRTNVAAWLLAALAAPNAEEARVALRVVLKLEPDHAQACTMLARLDAAGTELTASPAAPPALIKRPSHRGSRRNVVTITIILLSLVIITGGVLAFFLSLTGSPVLDQIGENLPEWAGQYPTAQAGDDGIRIIGNGMQIRGVISDGEVQRFRFQGRPDTEVFVGLGLMTVPSEADTSGAMELFDPNGYRFTSSEPNAEDFTLPSLPVLETGNISIIQTTIDLDGIWELRLIGRAGRSAGVYFLLMQCYPESGCQPPPPTF